MIDRASLLRRAGLGAGALSLLGPQLLGPGAAGQALAAAGAGTGDFPEHPPWRFALVSHDTLSPLFVATQFGAEDACTLTGCTYRWTGSPTGSVSGTVDAFKAAAGSKADGIAVSLADDGAFDVAVDAARRAGIPVIAFNQDASARSGNRRQAFVGADPQRAGLLAAGELASTAGAGECLVVAPRRPTVAVQRRLEGVLAGLARPLRPSVVRVDGDERRQAEQIDGRLEGRAALRAVAALDGPSSRALGEVLRRRAPKGVRAGGFDLWPADLALVDEGVLDFAVDQQSYLQGFHAILGLFLARISEGVFTPPSIDTSTLVTKANVKVFLETKSRFEGSSSRHRFPLDRV